MAAAAVPHTVKTVLAQTDQLVQPAMELSSHAKPATDAQIADATGPHRPVMVAVSHVTPQQLRLQEEETREIIVKITLVL
jgi:hypothetical protein